MAIMKQKPPEREKKNMPGETRAPKTCRAKNKNSTPQGGGESPPDQHLNRTNVALSPGWVLRHGGAFCLALFFPPQVLALAAESNRVRQRHAARCRNPKPASRPDPEARLLAARSPHAHPGPDSTRLSCGPTILPYSPPMARI